MNEKNKTNRFMELEGLRGLAALAVVVYHVMMAFYLQSFFGVGALSPVQHARFEDNLYANPLMGVLSGAFAVSIFFVLSGFVLSIGFFQTGNIDGIKRLAAKRYVRLMPPALISLLICYILMKLGLSNTQAAASITLSGDLVHIWAATPGLWDIIKDGLYGVFVGGSNSLNPVLWTMTTEFIGSFIVFGTLLFFAQSRSRAIAYGTLLIFTFNTWFLGFIIGMVFADLYSNGYIQQKARNILVIAALLLAGIYLGGYPFGTDLAGTAYGVFSLLPFGGLDYRMIAPTLGASFVVFAAIWATQLASILRKKYISGLGKYTFSVYLVHLPILYTFTMGVFVYLYGLMGYNKAVLVSLLLTVPVIVLATLLFEKYVDKKSVVLSSYWADVYFGKRELHAKERLADIRLTLTAKMLDIWQRLPRTSRPTLDGEID